MGIYIGSDDHSVTFKALFSALNLKEEGFEYDYGTIEITTLMEKVTQFMNDARFTAPYHLQQMGQEGILVFGHDVLGRVSSAYATGAEVLTLCVRSLLEGKTELSWG